MGQEQETERVEGQATSLSCPDCGSDDIHYSAPADVKSGGYGGMVYHFECKGCGSEWDRAQPTDAPAPDQRE